MLERGRSERIDSVLDDPGGRPAGDPPPRRPLGALRAAARARPRDRRRDRARQAGITTPAFSEDDLRLAESLTARAAIAVDLSEQVSRDAVRRVVEAQELERARLARELHDETGQALTSILLGLKPLEQTAESAEAGGALESVRELVISTLQNVAGWRSSCAPPHSTTSGSSRRSSGSPTRSASRAASGRPGVAARRGAAAERGRDDALPRDPGGADEHRQARGRRRVSILLQRKNSAVGRGRRGRRSGLRSRRDARGRLGLAGMRERVALAGGSCGSSRRPAGDYSGGRGAFAVTIRVLIVDDHAVVRSGLRRVLDAEADIETVGEAATAERRSSRRSRPSPTSCCWT